MNSISAVVGLWGDLDGMNVHQGMKLTFRGQPGCYKTLVPSLMRKVKKSQWGATQVLENYLVKAFQKHMQSLGLVSCTVLNGHK